MSTDRVNGSTLHPLERLLDWFNGILKRLSSSAGALTLAHVETSAQARTRLQADLYAIERCLRLAEPGTERYRQLAAERRRILVTLGPR